MLLFSESDLDHIAYPQAKLIEATKSFGISPLPDNFEKGICFGLVGLWSVKNAQAEKDFFHLMRLMIFYSDIKTEADQTPADSPDEQLEKENTLNAIADEMKIIADDAATFINEAILQQKFKIESSQKPSFHNLGWDLFSKTVFADLSSDIFCRPHLQSYVERALNENNFLRIELWQYTGKGHAIGIKKKQEKYYYYDPNFDKTICHSSLSLLLKILDLSSLKIFGETQSIEVRAFVHEHQVNTHLVALIKELQQFRLTPNHRFLVDKIHQELIDENIAFVGAYRNIEEIVQRILASKFIRRNKTLLNELNNKVLASLSLHDKLLQIPATDSQMAAAAAAATSFTP